jgi:hypothetical protein
MVIKKRKYDGLRYDNRWDGKPETRVSQSMNSTVTDEGDER